MAAWSWLNNGQPPSTTVNNGQPPQTGALAPAYDGNGNIHAYLDCATGAMVQRMEYDAFGNELTLDSVLEGGHAPASTTREVPFRFSTKYKDTETGLSYYGYRYYSAEMGRWLSRDPIEENGGSNLYAMVSNSQINQVDADGRIAGLLLWQLGCGAFALYNNLSEPDNSMRHCVATCQLTKCNFNPLASAVDGELWELLTGSDAADSAEDIKNNKNGMACSLQWDCRDCCNKRCKRIP